jgi:hypothetical protein
MLCRDAGERKEALSERLNLSLGDFKFLSILLLLLPKKNRFFFVSLANWSLKAQKRSLLNHPAWLVTCLPALSSSHVPHTEMRVQADILDGRREKGSRAPDFV